MSCPHFDASSVSPSNSSDQTSVQSSRAVVAGVSASAGVAQAARSSSEARVPAERLIGLSPSWDRLQLSSNRPTHNAKRNNAGGSKLVPPAKISDQN